MLRRNANARLAMMALFSGCRTSMPVRAQDSQGASDREAILASCATIFLAVESVDIPAVRASLAQLAMGQGLTLDAVVQLMAAEQQIRYRLTETTVSQSGARAIVRARWERRFTVAGDASAHLRSGTVALAFALVDGTWRITGLSGDNPFEHTVRR